MAIADFFNELIEIVNLMLNSFKAWIATYFPQED